MEIRAPTALKVDMNIRENWRRFLRNFTIYGKAAEYDKKKKEVQAAILLNCLGEDAIDLVHSFRLSSQQMDDPKEIIKAIDNYVKPQRNQMYNRYIFHSRSQFKGERFVDFYMALRKLAQHCDFDFLTESLIRDQLVLGIRDNALRDRLLRAEYNLDKVIKICRRYEAEAMSHKNEERKIKSKNSKTRTGNTHEGRTTDRVAASKVRFETDREQHDHQYGDCKRVREVQGDFVTKKTDSNTRIVGERRSLRTAAPESRDVLSNVSNMTLKKFKENAELSEVYDRDSEKTFSTIDSDSQNEVTFVCKNFNIEHSLEDCTVDEKTCSKGSKKNHEDCRYVY